MDEPVDGTEMRARGALVGMVFGSMSAQVAATAVRLGVADAVGGGERTAEDVAEMCGTDPQATLRLLRAMAALGLFTETRPGGFALTAEGALLREDQPGSVRSFVQLFADPVILRAWEHLDDSLRTGGPSFGDVFGTDFFSHLNQRPELSERFNAAMSEGSRAAVEAISANYDFGRFGTVADIGGGDGTLLSAVLTAHPGVRGIVYDTAEGLAQARDKLRRDGVADRCSTRAGDFFASVPAGADLYMLKSVIHDWDDDRAATILRNCREAGGDDARLLIVEPVLPPVVAPSMPAVMYLSDLNMLVNLGGRERTEEDFANLCAAAGYRLTGVTPLPPPQAFSLIEAAPA